MVTVCCFQGRPWDVVIDFIGMHPVTSGDAIDALTGGGVGHFIHISTISAYEMNLDEHAQMGARDHSKPHVKEEDMFALGRASPELREKRIKAKPYGGNKYLVEKLLAEQQGFPYTILRIPECVGPYSDDRHYF